jgi:hypothetical protein
MSTTPAARNAWNEQRRPACGKKAISSMGLDEETGLWRAALRTFVLLVTVALVVAGCEGGSGGKKTDGGGSAGIDSPVIDEAFDAAEEAGMCGLPATCEGYDNNPDAHVTAEITCLSPDSVAASAPFVLSIYGHHLAVDSAGYSIVTLGNTWVLSGVPASACQLEVHVPAGQLTAPGRLPVVVSPGGWTEASAPAQLTVR